MRRPCSETGAQFLAGHRASRGEGVEGLEVGTQILAGQVEMPAGSTLASDAELLVINITQQISAEELEAELEAALRDGPVILVLWHERIALSGQHWRPDWGPISALQ